MEDWGNWLVTGFVLIAAAGFLFRLAALITYACGFNPPASLIELWPIGVPSRIFAGIVAFVSFWLFFFIATVVFDNPVFDPFPSSQEIVK